MELADVAADLRALASRVRRNVPNGHDPERFHEELSDIAHRLNALADGVAPAPRRGKPARPVVTTEIIGGRRVVVQKRRMAFAIFVGAPHARRLGEGD